MDIKPQQNSTSPGNGSGQAIEHVNPPQQNPSTNQQVPPPQTQQTLSSTPQNDPELTGKIQQANQQINSIKNTYSQLIVGQAELLDSIFVTLLSRGHLLIEGVPGLAKTTAAHTVAASIGADFARIQCTPDMLPSDIVGSQIYNQERHEFITQLGPINHSFLLVDEINRTSAKTQSALLEAMQERQVSIGGKTHSLPHTFIVMATQNPIDQEGTYPLPEAQLDRFLLKHVVQYPNFDEEIEIVKRKPSTDEIAQINAAINTDDMRSLQELTSKIHTDERIIRYVVSIVDATRNPDKYGLKDIHSLVQLGASPRASLALLSAGRACALMNGSSYVTPDHIKPYLQRVLRHRLILTYEAEAENITADNIINKIGSVVQVP